MHTTTHPKETGCLLERLGTQTRHVLQIGTRRKAAALITQRDDGLRQSGTDAGHVAQQRRRCGIHLDAHPVHATFHDIVETLFESRLIHVVLILADADAFRIDLHQLGQRIL